MRSVTAGEMRCLDEKAISEYGIPSLLLMENAGRACAEEAARLSGNARQWVAVFAGKGNNGGDGFVAARHLANRGILTRVFFFQSENHMKPDPRVNYRILQRMRIPLVDCSADFDAGTVKEILKKSGVILDALFGTGLAKPVGEPFKTAISVMNDSGLPIVSVDVPSGLNADTGEIMGAAVRARVTVALGLPKKGFYLKEAPTYTGRIVVADISLPRELLKAT